MLTMDSDTTLPPWPEHSPWGTGRMSIDWADLLTAFGIPPEAITWDDGLALADMREEIARPAALKRLARLRGRL
jgi:hypothetical protein